LFIDRDEQPAVAWLVIPEEKDLLSK